MHSRADRGDVVEVHRLCDSAVLGIHVADGACDGDLDLKAVDTGENRVVESRNRVHSKFKVQRSIAQTVQI